MDLDGAVLAAAAAGGDLDVRRHADAEELSIATSTTRRLLGAQVVVAGETGDFAEGGAVLTTVVGDAGERGEREHVVGQEVLFAQHDRVDAQLEGSLVDGSLEQRSGLGPTRTSVRTRGRGVGGGHRHVELDGGEAVRAVAHPAGAGRQERTEPGIRATVAHQPHAQPGERAVSPASELDVLDLGAAVGEADHVLAAG